MEWVGQYWIQWSFGLMGSIFSGLFLWFGKKFKLSMTAQKAVNKGVQALLRDRIIQAYNHYMERGECPIYALDNVLALFKEYKALDGNGAIERLVGELKNLPIDRHFKEV